MLLDPYANAFNKGPTGSEYKNDATYRNFFGIRISAMIDSLHERKFEIDSSANVLRLQNEYYKKVGDSSIYDFTTLKSIKKIIDVYRIMQENSLDNNDSYFFQRLTK